VLRLVPRRLGDRFYDAVAATRYRIFGREKDACPILPPDLRARFLP
jgi:predicted DCC family thiol-disulfide oxidoreductase YuxK